jgi:hypothetical protein
MLEARSHAEVLPEIAASDAGKILRLRKENAEDFYNYFEHAREAFISDERRDDVLRALRPKRLAPYGARQDITGHVRVLLVTL